MRPQRVRVFVGVVLLVVWLVAGLASGPSGSRSVLGAVSGFALLAGVGLLLFTFGAWAFKRRDSE
jgi:hypothetical protein